MGNRNAGLLAVAGCAFVVGLSMAAQEGAGGEWTTQKELFSYKGESFSCEVKPDGIFKTIDVGGMQLFREVVLHGSYNAGDDKHDSRFFQEADPAFPLKIRQDGENKYTIKKEGLLKNANYKDGAARYVETVVLTPRGMTFTYETEQTVALSAASSIFKTLLYLPVKTYAARGSMMTPATGAVKTLVIPESCEKERALHVVDSVDIKFSLENGVLELKGEEGTSMSIMDCRSWDPKDQSFRIDIQPAAPWKPKPEILPAGKKSKWSFVITFTPHV